MTITDTPEQTLRTRIAEAVAYEAPFLIEKLLKNSIVDTAEEGEELFREVKRYFVLTDLDQGRAWNMYSLMVDEVWHQFILFTPQYMNYCNRYFGRYIPHNPSNAPKPESPARQFERATFEQFQARYQELFGEPLPTIWYDEETITLNRRLFSRWAGPLTVRTVDGTVELLTEDEVSVFTVNELAKEALEFIAHTGAFYVRELPGGLHDEEKIGLAAALVQCKVLRAAS
jgi:hypothetical protein